MYVKRFVNKKKHIMSSIIFYVENVCDVKEYVLVREYLLHFWNKKKNYKNRVSQYFLNSSSFEKIITCLKDLIDVWLWEWLSLKIIPFICSADNRILLSVKIMWKILTNDTHIFKTPFVHL